MANEFLSTDRIHQFYKSTDLPLTFLSEDQRYTMGDAESRRNSSAEAAACANDLRHQQIRLQDLRVFEMDIESVSDYVKVIIDRGDYYKEIESYRVEGVPVTTPKKADVLNSHHMVVLNDPEVKKNGNHPDDVVAIQTLYRNYDNYYTAFRPIKRSHRVEDSSGWFYFKDVKLPRFLMKNPRGETKAYKLTLSCAYTNLKELKVGAGSTRSMFKSYSKYTPMPKNYKAQSGDREKVVMANMVFFGEGQRFPEIMTELAMRMANDILEVLQLHLRTPINDWSVISVFVFRHLLGTPGMLEQVERMFGWDLRPGGEGDCSLSLLVGARAKISLLNYDKVYTRDLIKRDMQQRR